MIFFLVFSIIISLFIFAYTIFNIKILKLLFSILSIVISILMLTTAIISFWSYNTDYEWIGMIIILIFTLAYIALFMLLNKKVKK